MTTPQTLDRHAADSLRFIRDTMATAAGFTAVPGWGGALMGVTALITAAVAGPPRADRQWVTLWLADAAVAVAIGIAAIARKARSAGIPLTGPAARRFALAFVPAIAAGGALTIVFLANGLGRQLPGCWLLLYGAAVASGGAMSVRAVPIMGAVLMMLGGLAFMSPLEWGHLFLAAGFGAVQIGFGVVIARRHGG
jgi:hypothetical protein